MSNLALIRPRQVDFRTDQMTDWLDGLPVLGMPASAGVVAGASNAGVGNLTVGAVDAGTLEGVHILSVTGIAGGLTRLTVTDPLGTVTCEGVVGLPLYAGGLSISLAPVANGPDLRVGDTFALSVLPAPIDLTGLVFRLRATVNARSTTVLLSADSLPDDGSDPTMLNGGLAGTLAMRVARPAMARCPPGDFPYAITASDPVLGRTVPAFAGTIRHRSIPTFSD